MQAIWAYLKKGENPLVEQDIAYPFDNCLLTNGAFFLIIDCLLSIKKKETNIIGKLNYSERVGKLSQQLDMVRITNRVIVSGLIWFHFLY